MCSILRVLQPAIASTLARRECAHAQSTQSHDLDDWEAYLNLAFEDIRKFLLANHLCVGMHHATLQHEAVDYVIPTLLFLDTL